MADYLYHFTSKQHLQDILNSGYLKLTMSSVKMPTRWWVSNYTQHTDTENYKPVVWLTDNPIPDALGNGLEGVMDKVAVRITVKKDFEKYKYWLSWANANRMDKEWMKCFIDGRNYRSWFISENIIPVSEFISIEEL